MISRLISQNSQELSPFEGPIPNDAPIFLGKGGGRYVKLDTIVAQQWEQRFQKREVFGSNDIHNYGSPVGGLPYHDPLLPTWGWLQAEDVNNNLNISYIIKIISPGRIYGIKRSSILCCLIIHYQTGKISISPC
jgi:hypothetical protein